MGRPLLHSASLILPLTWQGLFKASLSWLFGLACFRDGKLRPRVPLNLALGQAQLGVGLRGLGFPAGSDSKESALQAGDLGSSPGLGRSPGGGHGNPLQYSYLENSHGQRSLVGYSPWHRKDLDTTE